MRRLADRVAKEAEARARAEAEAKLSQEAVKLQREADERVEAARRRAEQEVHEKVRAGADRGAPAPDRTSPRIDRSELDDLARRRIAEQAAASEPAGTRYAGGRRLRTF